MSPWLAIIGIGEDAVLPPHAQAWLAGAALVVGGQRHLALAAPHIRSETLAWPSPLQDAFPAIVARRGEPVVVLATGDPNWFGIAPALRRIVQAAETVCIPAVSSGSLACAHLGWALDEVETVSACGRPVHGVLPALQPGRRVLLLSADETTPSELAALLCDYDFGDSVLHVMQALGGPRERILTTTAAEGIPEPIDRLNLVAIEPIGPAIPRAPGLPDDMYEHDGQITKREVRAMTLAALAPKAGELLWDIGCGSGSISIEWCLAHPACHAMGIEPDHDRADRARRNAVALGVPHVTVIDGAAPEALAGLPQPAAVFVGGGARDSVLEAALAALPPGGRLVANAVTVETQTLLVAFQARFGGTLTRLAVERLDRLGHLHGFRPAMAVMQWAAWR